MEVGSKFKSMEDFNVTWRVEVLSPVDRNSNSTDVKGRITKVTWKIENFSTIKGEKHYSENFIVDGNKWRIYIYPKGKNVDYLSIYLEVVDSATLPSGWSRFAQVRFAVIDQIDRKTSCTKVTASEFNAKDAGFRFTSFLAISELNNPSRGYLVNDACLLEAYVSTDKTRVGSKFKSVDIKVTWRVEVLSAVDSKSNSTEVKGRITKVTWRIENFSSIKDKEHCSENFIVDGNKWRISIYPKGNNVDYLSIYLEFIDSATLHSGRSRYAQYGFAVIDQIDRKTSRTKVTASEFNAKGTAWGCASFLAISELHNPKKGYLVNDACLLEVYISTDRIKGLISHELVVEIDSDKHKIKEADCVQANEQEEPNGSVAIEPKERNSEDMKTFFTSLKYEFSTLSIVYSQEQAKEALAKLYEALNMNPANFYDLVNFSSLKKTFKILGSLDCSSTILTIEEKNELVAMEERLKELAFRAAKAVKDKNLLTTKRSIKQLVTRNLEYSLIKFEQLEQKLDASHEQVEEAKKNMQNMLGEQMEIFESSKKMKIDLKTLEKECVEYEANAKVAEEEEKNVKIEWKRIKDFIFFIKGKI